MTDLATDLSGRPADLTAPQTPQTRRAREVVGRFTENRPATIGACVVLLIVCAALLAPWISPFDPNAQDTSNTLQPPSGAHWLGTDDIGRDLFSRLLHGARLSLRAAGIAVALGAALGVLPGLVAGVRGGIADMVLSRLVDAIMCIPSLVLAIALVAVFGPGITQVSIAIGVAFAPRFYRVARGAAVSIAGETYIKSMRSLGASQARILLRHVLPNALPPLIVQTTLMFGFGLLAEAALSFLGMGAQPPEASWGSLLQRGSLFMTRAPHLSVIPGVTIMVAILAANLFGDGLQDARGARRGPASREA